MTSSFTDSTPVYGTRHLHYFRYPVNDGNLKAVCLIPSRGIRTSDARRITDKLTFSADSVVFNLSRSTCLPQILMQKRYELLKEATKDRVHQEQRRCLYVNDDAKKHIDLDFIFENVVDSGAYCAFISGSGSTLLALSPERRR